MCKPAHRTLGCQPDPIGCVTSSAPKLVGYECSYGPLHKVWSGQKAWLGTWASWLHLGGCAVLPNGQFGCAFLLHLLSNYYESHH